MGIFLVLVAERKVCLTARPGEGLQKALELGPEG